MLNLVTNDIADQRLLSGSFDAIRLKDNLTIVLDEEEKTAVMRQTIDALRMPNGGQFSFQNLFRIDAPNGTFYIAQVLIGYPSPLGGRGSQTFEAKYSYHTIGIAKMKTDLGITNLRPENKIDKLLEIVFRNDIDFEGAERFNDTYYLASDNRKKVEEYFNRSFIEAIAKHEDVLLSTRNKQLYISFTDPLNTMQSRAVEDIFRAANFLSR